MSAQSPLSTPPTSISNLSKPSRPRSVRFSLLEADAAGAHSPPNHVDADPSHPICRTRTLVRKPARAAHHVPCPPILTITPATPPTTLLLLPLTPPAPACVLRPLSSPGAAPRPIPIAAYSGVPPLPQPDAQPSPFQLPPAVSPSCGVGLGASGRGRSMAGSASPRRIHLPGSRPVNSAAYTQAGSASPNPLFTPLAAHLCLLHPNTPRPVIQYITHRLLSSAVPMGHGGAWEPVHAWNDNDGLDLSVAGVGMEGARGVKQKATEGRRVDGRLEEMYGVARQSWVLLDQK